MALMFEKIRFKNFLSYGNNWTEIPLDSHNKILITGTNGVGKSTMIDALSFALFGKAYRKINKPQLISSMNNSKMLVEVFFNDGHKKYMIRRGMKPNVFEIYIDGNLVDQDSRVKDYQRYLEENILNMNHKVFCQVVVLGSSSFVPFMQLTPADRRMVVEDILGIDIISKMFGVLKAKLSAHEKSLDDIRKEIKTEQKVMVEHKNNLTKWRESFDEEQKELQAEIDQYSEKQDAILAEALKCMDQIEKINEDSVQKAIDTFEESINNSKVEMGKIEAQEQIIDKSVRELINSEGKCPVCEEKIGEERKSFILTNRRDELAKLTILQSDKKAHIKDIKKRLNEVKADLTVLQGLKESLKKKQNESLLIKSKATQAKKYLTERTARRTEVIKEFEAKRDETDQAIQDMLIQIDRMEELLDYYNYLYDLFKDSGVKSKIIELFVPIINKQIAHYLDLFDFYVSFTLDAEFNEKIMSRFRDEFSYFSFSEGEKKKIDIALLLTWRDIARMKNSVSTNILFLDEVFDSSLDTNSRDCFMEILTSLSNKCTVFVITHSKDDLRDKFDESWKVYKRKDFSYIEME